MGSLNRAEQIFQDAARGLRPPAKLTVSQWADRYRVLSPEAAAEPGQWRTDRAPYTRGMMDAVNEVGIRRIVFECASQVGKTESVNNILGFLISQDPAPILFVWPTLDTAKAWSKERFAPMLRDTPCLKGKVKDARSRNSDNAMLHKIFEGGQIAIAGANAPSSLASRPIRIVLASEIDRFPVSAGAEGDPLALAGKRTTTFWNALEIWESTPTLKGASRIDHAYEQSDQRKFMVPCPKCGGFQILKWPNVTFPNKDPELAHYLCDLCHAQIDHREKFKMLRAGRWQAAKPFTGTAGFWLNEIYSPWITWKEMVKDFLEKKKHTETLKVFTNTALAECWEEEGASVDDGTLFGRREAYTAAVPNGGLVLTAGVDVQDDRLEMEVVAWGLEQECWSVTHRFLPGDPRKPEVWKNLDHALLETFRHESGVDLRIIAAFVDSGFLTKHVYQFCAERYERHVFPCKGSAGGGRPLITRPTKLGPRLRLYHVGVDGAKELLYAHLRLADFGPGYQHFSKKEGEYDREYFEQLTAEEMRTKFKNGFPTKVWVKTRARNEALDCRIYAMGALEARQVNFAEVAKDLERRKSELNPEAPPPPKEEFTVSEAPPAAPPVNPRFNRARRRNPWVFRGW